MAELSSEQVTASLPSPRVLVVDDTDVVLVDAHLGAELGTDLIETMLAQDPAAAGRCLMITGGSTAIVPRGVACLAKPFRPADLLHAVRALHQPDSAETPGPLPGPAVATENGSPRSQPAM